MKKLIFALSILLSVGFLAPAGNAALFTLPQDVLLDETNFDNLGPSPYYPANSGTLHSRSASGNSVLYTISLDGLSGWSDIQIGDGFDHPYDNAGMVVGSGTLGGDLTGYTTYSLKITNPNTSGPSFMANISLNSGWTDIGETDSWYQGTWTWLNPGESNIFTIDLTQVTNLNHVTQIGFKIGANVTGDESWNDYEWLNSFSVEVTPVPIPGALLLLGSGLIGLFGLRRKLRNN